jgi:hypothetical protein
MILMKKIFIFFLIIVIVLSFGCIESVPHEVSECQTSVEAIVKATPMLQYTQNDLLDQCIMDRAIKAKDYSICEYIMDANSKALCIKQINTPLATTPKNNIQDMTNQTDCSNLLVESDLKKICGSNITIDYIRDDTSEIINGCIKAIYLSSPSMFIDIAMAGPRDGKSVEEKFNLFIEAQKNYEVFTRAEEIIILGNRTWATETINSARNSVLLNDKQIDVSINERGANGTIYPCNRDKLDELTKTVLNRIS